MYDESKTDGRRQIQLASDLTWCVCEEELQASSDQDTPDGPLVANLQQT
jgi:hypothetical protein